MQKTPIIQRDINFMLENCPAMDQLRGKTFLITGATGFIGSYLVHALLTDAAIHETDTCVYAIVRSAKRARKMFSDYEEGKQIIYLEQDILKPISLQFPVDYVIHCASNAAPKEYDEDPVGTMRINFIGTDHLLSYAKRYPCCRFLYVSTIEIYGNVKSNEPISENEYGLIDSCNPRSCYPLSKKTCETLCISYGKQYSVPISIGRLAYIFGPGMKENDTKVAALFPREIAAGHNIVMKSKGEQKRSYCYVTDAINGLFTVLAYGDNQQTYNISSDIGITSIRNMAERLVALFPEKKVKVIFDLPSEKEKSAFSFIGDSILDSEKLKSMGWEPLVKLDEGLMHTVSNYEYEFESRK